MLVIALSLYHGVNASNLKSPCVVLICLYFCLLSIYNFNYLAYYGKPAVKNMLIMSLA